MPESNGLKNLIASNPKKKFLSIHVLKKVYLSKKKYFSL